MMTDANTGVTQLKFKMSEIRTKTEELNRKADDLEAERKKVDESRQRSERLVSRLDIRCNEISEKLMLSQRKLDMLTNQVHERENFLNESTCFQKSLTSSSLGDSNIIHLRDAIEYRKKEYEANAKKCRKAEKRLVKVTRKTEAAAEYLKEEEKEIELLNLELEYMNIDELRKTEKCQEACHSLKRGLEEMTKREWNSYKRKIYLKKQVKQIRRQLKSSQQQMEIQPYRSEM